MKNKFIISMLIPILILLGMTVKPVMALYNGQEVRLKTQPVDPSDIFRGDYVTLNYEINDVNLTQFPELNQVKEDLWDYEKTRKYFNRKVYVTLKEEKGFFVVAGASFSPPAGNQLYLAGKIAYVFNKVPRDTGEVPREPVKEPPNKLEPAAPDTVRVQYELDKFFVPENTGTQLEELSRKGQLLARVKIYNGYGLLTKIEEAR
ncbi:MAG TPA: GDYXXLXY domain-containing protein [Bacillota bacterium]|nr:GDYXXLXY domain-containing protein [Bacillota bacterium]